MAGNEAAAAASVSSEMPKEILASSVAKKISTKQVLEGEITFEGENLKYLLAADEKYQTPQDIRIDIDNGRWQLELNWSPTYFKKSTSGSNDTTEKLPLVLGIYLHCIRDVDERRRGGDSSRSVTLDVKIKASRTSPALVHRTFTRRFFETTVLSRSDSPPDTIRNLGWEVDAEALRRKLTNAHAVIIDWKLEETKDTLYSELGAAVHDAPSIVASAATLFHLAAEKKQSDLCFVFPPITSGGRRPYIHARQDLFEKIPYFEKAFAFEGPAPCVSDNPVADQKEARGNGARASNAEPGLHATGPDRVDLEAIADSDDENASDNLDLTRLEQFSQDAPRSDERVIAVPDFSYRTYLALLEYVYTGHIVFAPLRSQYKGRAKIQIEGSKQPVYPTYRSLEEAYVEQRAFPNTMANPCSPKSMFRLANKLDIQELESRALEEFKLQVTPYNVLDEMCSETVHLHKELLSICTDCIIENWDECSGKEEVLEALRHGVCSDIPDLRQAWLSILKSSGTGSKRKAEQIS